MRNLQELVVRQPGRWLPVPSATAPGAQLPSLTLVLQAQEVPPWSRARQMCLRSFKRGESLFPGSFPPLPLIPRK